MRHGRDEAGTVKRLAAVGVLTAIVAALSVGPLAHMAEAAVPGLQRTVATSAFNMASPKSATASCPANTRVIGTGAELSGATGHVVLKAVVPTSTSVRVLAQADQDGAPQPWLVRAYAICAHPLPGMETVIGMSAVDSAAAKAANANCPANKVVLGVGAEVVGGGGEVFLTRVRPNLPTNGSAIAREDQDGTPVNWYIRAFSICAFPPAGIQQLASVTAQNSASPKSISTACPAGKRALAMGVDAVSAGGQVIMSVMVPRADLAGATGGAYEDQDGTGGLWFLRTYVVCATP